MSFGFITMNPCILSAITLCIGLESSTSNERIRWWSFLTKVEQLMAWYHVVVNKTADFFFQLASEEPKELGEPE